MAGQSDGEVSWIFNPEEAQQETDKKAKKKKIKKRENEKEVSALIILLHTPRRMG